MYCLASIGPLQHTSRIVTCNLTAADPLEATWHLILCGRFSDMCCIISQAAAPLLCQSLSHDPSSILCSFSACNDYWGPLLRICLILYLWILLLFCQSHKYFIFIWTFVPGCQGLQIKYTPWYISCTTISLSCFWITDLGHMSLIVTTCYFNSFVSWSFYPSSSTILHMYLISDIPLHK